LLIIGELALLVTIETIRLKARAQRVGQLCIKEKLIYRVEDLFAYGAIVIKVKRPALTAFGPEGVSDPDHISKKQFLGVFGENAWRFVPEAIANCGS
jgi:hypothetical protein